MRTALIINRVYPHRQQNLETIRSMVQKATSTGAEFILFPEAAFTGLINNDIPTHDLPLGVTIPGIITDALSDLCRSYRTWLGIGLLERDGSVLYDSAILVNPTGHIVLHYRRIQPQWHGTNADPAVYQQGTQVKKACTPWGTVAFLICGDLFDDDIVVQFRNLKADWLLFPFARSFDDGSYNQQRWDTEELPIYCERIIQTRTPALMVNYLADKTLKDGNTFGGAWVIHANGEVFVSHPVGQEGLLFFELTQIRP